MDSGGTTTPHLQAGVSWRTVLVIGIMAAIVWYIWRRGWKTKPTVPLTNNSSPAPPAPAGISLTFTEKLARLVDTAIPVVMTSGSVVQYDEDEIGQIVRQVLQRLNAMGESVTLMKVVDVSKTQDSYKTVTYDILINVHDAITRVGLLLNLSVLIPVSGTLYIRKFQMYNKPESQGAGLQAATDPAGFASYDSPLQVLSNLKLPA